MLLQGRPHFLLVGIRDRLELADSRHAADQVLTQSSVPQRNSKDDSRTPCGRSVASSAASAPLRRRLPSATPSARIGADGGPFAPAADGNRVDFQTTGQMLAELWVIEATDKRVRAGFATERSPRLAALHEEGTSRMPARFLRLSSAMVTELVRFLKDRMGKR